MTLNEFKTFWLALTTAYPWDYRDDESRREFARKLRGLPVEPCIRAVKTCSRSQYKEPPTAEYLAYLAGECNGAPDLLYKAVRARRERR